MRNKKGFTLVELIVVIAIIGILSAVAVPSLFAYVNSSKKRKAQAEAEAYSIKLQVEFSTQKLESYNTIFNLEDIIISILKHSNEYSETLGVATTRKALTPSYDKYHYVFSYDENKIYALDPKLLSLYEDDECTIPLKEEALFPNVWQVNSDIVSQYYGYFAEFPKYRFKYGNNDHYGYDITYSKNQFIPYGSTPGLYNDKNELKAEWSEIGSFESNMLKFKKDKIQSFGGNGTKIIVPYPEGANSNYLELTDGTNLSSSIKQVWMPNGITNIVNGFSNNAALEFVRYPEGIEGLGNDPFGHCLNMHYVHLPDSIKNVGTNAFVTSGIKNIILPSGIESLPAQAMSGVSSLECFAGSSGLKIIGDQAFNNCTKLREVYINKVIEHVGNQIFYNCSELSTIYYDGNHYRFIESSIAGLKDSIAANNNQYASRNPAVAVVHWQNSNPYDQDFVSDSRFSSLSYWHYVGFKMEIWDKN